MAIVLLIIIAIALLVIAGTSLTLLASWKVKPILERILVFSTFLSLAFLIVLLLFFYK